MAGAYLAGEYLRSSLLIQGGRGQKFENELFTVGIFESGSS